MAKILLVGGGVNIASFIERELKEFRHTVSVANDGNSGWELIRQEVFDLLIMDIVMPGISGLEPCHLYRRQYGYLVSMIMLTVLDTAKDTVKRLDAGAGDYLVKPLSFQKLEARIKTILRRGREDSVRQLVCNDLVFNYSSRHARHGEAGIGLTVREYRLLEYFMIHQGLVLSRLTLLRDVWDKNFDTNTNIMGVYVNYLRGKIDKDFSKKPIHTVVSSGYIIYA